MRKGLIAFVAVAAFGAMPASASAATQFVVDITADEQADPGTGCSLREALGKSSNGGVTTDCPPTTIGGTTNLITFSPILGSSPTINLNNSLLGLGQLDIQNNPVNIVGPGVTVNGAPAAGQRIMAINGVPAPGVGITGLTIFGGSLTGTGTLQGGGISSNSNLTLTNTTVAGNSLTVTSSSAVSEGGGIFVSISGTLTLNNSVIANNQSAATVTSGASQGTANGGGIVTNGPLVMHNSYVVGNHADATNTGIGSSESKGGGINARGSVQIDHGTIAQNQSSATNSNNTQQSIARGGGLYLDPPGAGTVELTTIAKNLLFVSGPPGSTFFQEGGGAETFGGGADSFISSTIASNGLSPASSTSGTVRGMNFYEENGGTKTFKNTIIAYPVGLGGTNCAGSNRPYTTGGAPNVDFPTDATLPCFMPGFPIQSSDPLLAPLGGNGGLTPTMLPADSSPVIDAGTATVQTLAGDQRGFTRPVRFPGVPLLPFAGADGSDIGAVEIQLACAGQQTPGGPCPTGPTATPSNAFNILGSAANKKNGTALLTVGVPGPGQVNLSGNGVVPLAHKSVTATSAGNVQLVVAASGKKKKKLKKKGKVNVSVTVTYTPTGGTAASKSTSVKLKKRSKR